jgi:hypothetical protein
MNTIAAKQARSGMVRRRPPKGGRGGGWQQRLDQPPQLIRNELVYEGSHGRGSCHTKPRERNAVLAQRASLW